MGQVFPAKYLHRRKFWKEFQQKYTQQLEQIKADIVVSTFNEEYRYLLQIKDGSRKILETHFCRYYRWYVSADQGLKTRLHALYKIFRDKRIASRYDAFVCLSNEDAVSWRPMKNLHVIENPITIPDKGIADTSLRRVIAVGRFAYQKSHDVLVRCWAKIPAEVREGWTLDIYGDGALKPNIELLIAKLGLQDSVRLHSSITNISEEYMKSSIYCSTSKYEGFSLAMCEAMSAGLPVITFAHPCGASDMILDESMGMLVPMGREDLYVEKLQMLMTDHELRKNIGANARKCIFERYSMEVIMQKWHALFVR